MKPPFHYADFDSLAIGVDPTNGRFAEVSIKTCRSCHRKWLNYQVEYEAFPESGRWYRGLLSDQAARLVTPENAVARLAELDWYFYGGSYFGTEGRKGAGQLAVDL